MQDLLLESNITHCFAGQLPSITISMTDILMYLMQALPRGTVALIPLHVQTTAVRWPLLTAAQTVGIHSP